MLAGPVVEVLTASIIIAGIALCERESMPTKKPTYNILAPMATDDLGF